MEKSVESLLTLDEIIEATGGIHVMGQVDGENGFCFTSVHTDSRDIVEKSLFVPLVGEFQDGHRYIPQAAEKGASVVFIRMSNYEKDGEFFKNISLEYPYIVFIAVENTMHALQDAAAKYVEKFPHLMRVGITGSSG
ncbi:MAG: UDP-N-acetylmuramoylalanyl-D-glutamate--2,6-diaminopimelate ligase, partial [Treponema sp.]|nr:UDP-N-acetylmuramoylalanyl-D-glutamate--2,6-diaminopimelate ligase [Treponema sp.]